MHRSRQGAGNCIPRARARSQDKLYPVKEKRVYLIPTEPFSFIDSPPSVNRIIGLYWLGCLLYPDVYSDIDLDREIKEFYSLFYGYLLSDEEVKELMEVQP